MARMAIGIRHNYSMSPSRYQLLRRVPASVRLLRAPARSYSSAQSQSAFQEPPPPTYRKRSLFGRILGFSAIAISSFFLGIITNPDVFKMHSSIVSIPSDEETNSLYTPPDEVSKEINDFINTHPLSVSLRADPRYTESRPHMKYPAELRSHSLTGGTLSGPGRIVVPPFAWNTEDGSSFVSIFYLGSDLSGHPGIVHGGLLATLLDEGLARTCFSVLPNKVGVTANLNIDYRSPAPAGSFFVMRAKTTKVDGRKAWVEGWIESLPDDGSEPTKYVEAKALFIEPKNAALIPRLYKVT
ncbi:thioesterase family protein [Microsporum canis CBS 113480]|uniref:Thioesterase family protein n=1 Tax=Arthroderma otae (strain ATCC MYA-4605 / CBS 113480) TaxID=554155 RepID=C5FHK7_ARTOC|nr:thioesterase family protein [Microsporum canis CBS 113480]EEQ28747.1 thioesterase family protein [Microsporum canis CBS 113480]